MLIFNPAVIGNRLYEIRKRKCLTQSEVAEFAEISDRTYADIERGTANMRVGTMLRICNVFHITPNDILIEKSPEFIPSEEDIFKKINSLDSKDKNTVLSILSIYLNSLE